jgi:hypothetical protein
MELDAMIEMLKKAGFTVLPPKGRMIVDSTLGDIGGVRTYYADSASQSPHIDELERLRLDSAKAQSEYLKKLDPSVETRSENHSHKSTQALRDIAKAAYDSANSRLEGYLG